MTDLTVVIDADFIPYAVGYAAAGEPIAYVLATVKKSLDKIQEETGATQREVYLKGTGNFRDEVAVSQPYKGHRKTEKPEFFEEINEYLRTYQKGIQVDNMEVDDKVSSLLWEDFKRSGGSKEEATIILSSKDKDLKNTPGWHHNPNDGSVYWVTQEQAARHFWYQMLAGDTADNIKGLPSLPKFFFNKMGLRYTKDGAVGEGTAKKLLKTTHGERSAELLVWECYFLWGKDRMMSFDQIREYFLEQAQLLWMVREITSSGDPVMYTIDEDIYEEAHKRYCRQYPDQSEQSNGGVTEEHKGDSGYSYGEGATPSIAGSVGSRSEDSDKHGEPLTIQPFTSN